MSTAFSQDFVQADRLIRRRYVQIPGKQKDLLERPDAWSENLSHGPHGMINVPPEVLQHVKDFHARKHSRPSQQPNLTQPPSLAGSSAPPKLSTPKEPLPSPKGSPKDQAGDDRGTQLSWSPSPPRPPPGDRSVQPTKQPEFVSPLRNQLPSQPALLKRKATHMSLCAGTPSSTAQSDAVPYEPLSALSGKPHPPVNRGANRVAATQSTLPVATPPSAQADAVSSTLSNTARADNAAARPFNKRRRVDELELSDKELSDKEHETTRQRGPLSESDSRPPPGKTHDDRNTSSASFSTPSLPSQTAVGQYRRSDALPAASAGNSNEQSSFHYTPTYEGRPRDTPTQQKNVLRHTASGSSMPPAPAQPSVGSTHSELVKAHHSHTETTVRHRTPYEEFKVAYPDYEESTGAFIRACKCVDRLESKRLLPEILYDDFVRAYSTGYMYYFEGVQERNYQDILLPHEWYNENVKDIVYTKKIVRRDNLPAILEAFPTAVRQIKESIPPEAESKRIGDEDGADDEDHDHDHEEDLGLEESEAEEISAPRLSPEFHVSSPGPAAIVTSAVVGGYDSKETNGSAAIVPASSRKRQYTETAEEIHPERSLPDGIALLEGSHRPRVSSPSNPQEPETIQDGGAALREATQGIERTPPSRKSPNQSQSGRNAATTADSTLKSGPSQRKLLAPLQSSPPPSAIASINRPANDEAISPPTKRVAKPSSPAFRSQAESSEDELDSFDPPVKKAASPWSRPASSNEPAFLTQAEAVYEIPGTPDRQSEEPMPPPGRQSVARSPVASQPRHVQEQAASTATTATAVNHDEVARRHVPKHERSTSRASIGSSIGARRSPASSNRPRANLDLFKPRAGETKEERSKRNVERFKKFLSKKTPGSTAATTK